MSDPIHIEPAEGDWVIRAGGAVIGETSAALRLSENGHAPVIYFPRGDIAMAFLDRTDKTTHCPHKGDATYYSIETKNVTLDNVAWSYETPIDGVARIAGHLAFQTDKVAVEQL